MRQRLIGNASGTAGAITIDSYQASPTQLMPSRYNLRGQEASEKSDALFSFPGKNTGLMANGGRVRDNGLGLVLLGPEIE